MKLVVFSGAGISAESGLSTFRDSDGLWEKYDINTVASIEGWKANPALVLEFYNKRREQADLATPNPGHKAIAELQDFFDVTVITQNVDTLHEKAGSKNVLHLHGDLATCKSSGDENLIYPMPAGGLKPGDKCEKGFQLRPNIVWFGEAVYAMDEAIQIADAADILLVVGTSLSVYPAAAIATNSKAAEAYYIDPATSNSYLPAGMVHIKEKASTGLPALASELKRKYADHSPTTSRFD